MRTRSSQVLGVVLVALASLTYPPGEPGAWVLLVFGQEDDVGCLTGRVATVKVYGGAGRGWRLCTEIGEIP